LIAYKTFFLSDNATDDIDGYIKAIISL